ncbi:MAG: cytochrome c biogenesis protein CcsA [Verrucomicrobia bacterium]|nr:cytochrome c biogenesis protein CcsA [Verrucomicrobiota bacterium]
MKNYFAPATILLALIAVAATLRPTRNTTAYDTTGFSRLPVLVNGRVKPLDTVARTSLLMLQGRQRVTTPDRRSIAPAEWLLDVMFVPAVADEYQHFEIVHPDVLALMNLTAADGAGGKRFSFHQLTKGLAELDRQAKLAYDTESAVRTPFQRATIQLRDGVILYQRLQNTLNAASSADFLDQLARFDKTLATGLAATKAHGGTNPGASPEARLLLELSASFGTLDSVAYFRAVPPPNGADTHAWQTAGTAWSASLNSGKIAPAALAYANLGRAWQLHQPEAFNKTVADFRASLESTMAGALRRCDVEGRFNSAQPFYTSTLLYVAAFLLAVASWLKWPGELGRAAFWLVGIAFLLETTGIGARMWLESRPPVTNLYSSALFVGWGAVALCLVLEYVYKNAIGSVAAGLIGFATLVIAHHLALGGDTMEMMRAVLDSNFWLATHVVTVTVGYSATFLAGFLALIYVLRGTLTRSLSQPTADALAKMIYGIVCFATLFSFVGTVLGGIWADQSWGRFWGWDPKENGALLIVIWNAVILHARWGGLIKQRGLAVLSIFGNIVTAWSWFGVNMLGVGLHSYGFMDAAFWWLVLFVASQLAVIAIAALPTEKWRSFRATAA